VFVSHEPSVLASVIEKQEEGCSVIRIKAHLTRFVHAKNTFLRNKEQIFRDFFRNIQIDKQPHTKSHAYPEHSRGGGTTQLLLTYLCFDSRVRVTCMT